MNQCEQKACLCTICVGDPCCARDCDCVVACVGDIFTKPGELPVVGLRPVSVDRPIKLDDDRNNVRRARYNCVAVLKRTVAEWTRKAWNQVGALWLPQNVLLVGELRHRNRSA